MLGDYREFESVMEDLDRKLFQIKRMEFWTNQILRWLYGGYRNDVYWKGRSFPMDN